MGLHVRLNVTARFSVTLSVDGSTRMEPQQLNSVVAEHIERLVADGAAQSAIETIEIAEIATCSDTTIIGGTNA